MNRARFVLVGFAAPVAITVAAIALASPGPPAGHDIGNLSNTGEAVDLQSLSADDQRVLEHTGVAPSVRLLARRGAVGFYSARQADGSTCFMTGSSSNIGPRFGTIFCPRAGADAFPSAQSPILDSSRLVYDTATGESRLMALAGFAVDGVAQVGTLDSTGRIDLTRVANNVYLSTPTAPRPITAIVALDRDGREVARIPLQGS